MNIKDIILSNYEASANTHIDTVCNFLLTPLVSAVGRKITVIKSKEKIEFSVKKTSHISIRIFAAFSSLLLFPVTLGGICLRYCSKSHKQFAKKEQEYVIGRIALRKLIDDTSLKFPSIFKEGTDLSHISVDSIRNEFKESISYENLRKLKKDLSFICKEMPQSLDGSGSINQFKEVHRVIGALYYEKFSPDHIARNLREKKEIPAIKKTLKDLMISETHLEPETEEIRLAFSAKVKPTEVTWLHGTQSPTIAGVIKSGNLLKPSGELRKNNELAFCGENGQGCFGLNDAHISGVPLEFNFEALAYAHGGVGKSDKIGQICSAKPRKSIKKIYSEIFKNWKTKLLSSSESVDTINEINIDYIQNKTNLYNFIRHMKILMTLEPDLFEELITPEIIGLMDAIDTLLEQTNFEKSLLQMKEMFSSILNFKKNLPHYTEEDRQIISASYPMVFGSNVITLANKRTHEKGKFARKVPDSLLHEYAYKGNLALGDDLPFLFVPYDRVKMTRDYLSQKGIDHVNVHTISALRLATDYETFKKIKARKYSHN